MTGIPAAISDSALSAAVALRSELVVAGTVSELDEAAEPGRGKALLVRPAAVPIASRALVLVPCESDADWSAYADLRVPVEAGFGLPESQARDLVTRTRERGHLLGLRLWLAHDGPTVAGGIGAFRLGPPYDDTARLQEVDVFPAHRGRGLGDALLEVARRLLVAEGVRTLVLGADEDDWPLQWYLRRGFTTVARVAPMR